MATVFAGNAPRTAEQAERRFFMIMSAVMVIVTIAGFALNFAMGRSTFASPAIYHVHALVFMGWPCSSRRLSPSQPVVANFISGSASSDI